MKWFSEFLMIMCFMTVGKYTDRAVSFFLEGNNYDGWWAIATTAMFMLLGAWNLAFVKLDAKKEAK